MLEPLRVDHAEEMVPVLADPLLYVHTGGSPPLLAELQARYARQVVGTSPDGSEGWLNWLLRLRSDERLVGFVQAALSGGGAKLAWVVAPSEQGAGLATEAAATVVEWLGLAGLRETERAYPSRQRCVRRRGSPPGDGPHRRERGWGDPLGCDKARLGALSDRRIARDQGLLRRRCRVERGLEELVHHTR